ncbi:hypothetical protein K5I29_02205 [Flavobacterium agricola]|uniref:Uncharacterized protein n=1 Tax=Flavobacterium agricola TaxID=2870839 RepID=A0ABY6M0F8_9FLAO|nr:hypothetical protein [Flavobacterium agricola]UYW01757.1 hypothetical protein K5I29_02205 [Flavobacterium agricola]
MNKIPDKFDYVRSHKSKDKIFYRFTDNFQVVYIVEVCIFKYDVYVVKFYQKRHRLSNKRFNFKNVGITEANIFNFLKILNTVLSISLELLQEKRDISFGFLGAPTEEELDIKLNSNNINIDNTVRNTIKYRIYYRYCNRYLNPKDFDYVTIKTTSIILLKNKKYFNQKLTDQDIVNEIVNNILPNL